MLRKIFERVGGGWIFLILVCLAYIIIALLNFITVKSALHSFITLLLKLLPIIAVVFIFIFILNLFLDQKRVITILGKGSGLKGWIIAVAGGILSSGPIYMWYPLLSDLKEKGMRDSLIASFLYNRAVKIPLLPMMVFYFGVRFTIVLTFYMILFSIINGIVVERLLMIKSDK